MKRMKRKPLCWRRGEETLTSLDNVFPAITCLFLLNLLYVLLLQQVKRLYIIRVGYIYVCVDLEKKCLDLVNIDFILPEFFVINVLIAFLSVPRERNASV